MAASSSSIEVLSLRASPLSSLGSFEDITMPVDSPKVLSPLPVRHSLPPLEATDNKNASNHSAELLASATPLPNSDNQSGDTNGIRMPPRANHSRATDDTVDTEGLKGIVLPVELDLCWRCGYPGHRRDNCTRRRLMFCSRCGTVGVLSRTCTCSSQGTKSPVLSTRPLDRIRAATIKDCGRSTMRSTIPPLGSPPHRRSHSQRRRSPSSSYSSSTRRRQTHRPNDQPQVPPPSHRPRPSSRGSPAARLSSRSVGIQAFLFTQKATRDVGAQTEGRSRTRDVEVQFTSESECYE